ncbi:hypothetical protein KOW79_000666 [Hemibagrus wyckioides]|uniref:Uncharacterized protein n=1 Tax=Hemibagrus wyckioides TaxID=337641 RepID=A0A9D3SYU1_9TELE|nr:hypothetical protein KOW79_000666 [Hemibagrus wyckioides]
MKAVMACRPALQSSGLEKCERTMQAQASALILSNAALSFDVGIPYKDTCAGATRIATLLERFLRFLYREANTAFFLVPLNVDGVPAGQR